MKGYLKKMDSILNLPLSRTYKWYTVSKPLVHLHGRFLNLALFSSSAWIEVARWIQSRHEECTAAISTRALKESDGPSYFHLTHEKLIVNYTKKPNRKWNYAPKLSQRKRNKETNIIWSCNEQKIFVYFFYCFSFLISLIWWIAYCNVWLYAPGFSERYFILFATESTSLSSLICKIEPGAGAKSWILGAPITTGTDPEKLQKGDNVNIHNHCVEKFILHNWKSNNKSIHAKGLTLKI